MDIYNGGAASQTWLRAIQLRLRERGAKFQISTRDFGSKIRNVANVKEIMESGALNLTEELLLITYYNIDQFLIF
jgi:hypothetical protein